MDLNILKFEETAKSHSKVTESTTKDIAIIGIAARLPMADSKDVFWDNLINGKDCVSEFPESRQKDADIYANVVGIGGQSKGYNKGAYLKSVDKFDYSFFKISPKEASLMSPDQKIFLETALQAIEDSGYGNNKLRNSCTGIYLGYTADTLFDYKRLIEKIDPELLIDALPGNLSSIIPGRISYLLDLKGPSMCIDTACSSSLVAVHLACRALRSMECDMAIAGSVKTNLLPIKSTKKLGIESSDGRARTFDDSSDGTGMGEGAAAIILKPLNKAKRDGDNIYAVIKGSAVNQDGNSIGITAPNATAQQEVIVSAWEDSGIDPGTISYIEAHGTGTKLGDPIEIDGITRAFKKYTDEKQFCAIGSVKTNIGHLDCAAGIMGIIKAVLSLKNKQIPPSLHFKNPNKKISFEESPVYVNSTLAEWKGEFPRRCGVSAFGLSGTNCHVVLEEAPKITASINENKINVLTLSAKSKDSLIKLIASYGELIVKNKSIDMDSLCYTANTGRDHYNIRLAIVFGKRDEIINCFKKLIRDGLDSDEEKGIYYSGNLKTINKPEINNTARDNAAAAAEETYTNEAAYGKEQLNEICIAYTNGEYIDWGVIYKNKSYKKVSLPVYPFEEKRSWIEISANSGNTAINEVVKVMKQDPELMKEIKELIENKKGLQKEKNENANEEAKDDSIKIKLLGKEDGNYTGTEKLMASLWCKSLGYNEIDINDDFYELGGDSIIAIQIVNEYEKQTGNRLDESNILEHDSIKSLSSFLDSIEEQEEADSSEITRGELKEYYPLSSAQKRMYILNQFEGIGTSYNMPMAMSIEGRLDLDRLKKAVNKIIERHEAFRTSFHVNEKIPVQKIHEKIDFNINVEECRDPEKVPGLLKSYIKPFHLEKAPLFRANVVKIKDERHIIFFDVHHIVTDGMSSVIFDRELIELYKGEELEKPKIQYVDYSIWQNEQLEQEWIKKQEEYWLKQFEGDIPVLEFPTDYKRPSIQSFEGDRVIFEADETLSRRILKLAEKTGTTLYMVLMSAYKVLLSKYTGQEDIIAASPVTGRKRQELENVIGMFVNTIAIRSKPNSSKTFLQYLQEIKQITLKAHDNSDYPFENLINKLNLQRDLSRTPLFDTMLTLQNTGKMDVEFDNLKFRQVEFENNISKFDLNLNISVSSNKIKFDMEYCTKLFKRETIKRLSEHFINIFDTVTINPEIKINEINMLSKEEYQKIVSDFNNTESKYPGHMTIQQLFKENAAKNPDNMAVEFGGQKMTYGELDSKSNSLAKILRQKGVKKDTIVAIKVKRSLELAIGIMSVLKAGGAYLPIDPVNPDDRIKFMIEDSGAQLILTQEEYCKGIEELNPDVEVINLENPELYLENNVELYTNYNSRDLAYVIYTSGSTGKPKGVMIEHRSLMNFLYCIKNTFNQDINEIDKCLSLTSISFDVSVCEIFLPLAFGAALVLYEEQMISDIGNLCRTLIEKQITFSYIPPTILTEVSKQLMENTEKVKLNKMLVGVEPIKDTVLEEFTKLNPKIRIINGYGPTEDTICATFHKYKSHKPSGRNVPIGKPLANTKIYILDKDNNPVPTGMLGELCISGDGVSRGYLNRLELTKEKFVKNPFEKEQIMYRTGDHAKWLDSGDIKFIGRVDDQVKIRGYRIELGEIESLLLKHEEIKEAVVLAKESQYDNKYLCAYVKAEKELVIQEIRKHLSRELPDYMIPSSFVQLKEFPTTQNGKIDRKALPEPDGSIYTASEFVVPTNQIEEKLVEICRQILNVEKIGINHNFFEMGGNSIKVTELVAGIHKELNVKVPFKEIFQSPTIKDIAKYIDTSNTSIYTSIEPIEEKEYYELSSSQKRLYVLNQVGEVGTSYNVSNALIIEGEFDKVKFEETLNKLVERHESFRTSFEFKNGKPMQKVHKNYAFKIDYIESHEEKLSEIVKEFIRPFDLGKVPLLRVVLIKLCNSKHVLVFDMHHIISDGMSMGILIREFISIYNNQELPELRIQYKDFAKWQNELIKTETLNKQEKYWIEKLKGSLPVLTMPLDYKRPEKHTFKGETAKFELSREKAERLDTLAKSKGTTLNTVVFALYSLLINKYSGQDDMIIGSLIAGRQHPDLKNIIGVFMNFLPARIKVEQNNSFVEHLEQTKKELLNIYENQDIPFDGIISNIDIRVDYSRNPIFDTMLVFHNEFNEKDIINIGDLSIGNYEFDSKTATLDFKMDVFERYSGNFDFIIQYNTDLFKKDTIIKMLEHFNMIIDKVIANKELKISELKLFSDDEMKKIKEKRELNNAAVNSIKITVSSTFTDEPMGGYVKWWCKQFGEEVSLRFAPYNQVFQQLIDRSSLISINDGINLIMVRFEDWIRDNGQLTDKKIVEKLEGNFNNLLELLKNEDKKIPYFVGVFPVSTHLNLSNTIVEYLQGMNIRWKSELEKIDGIYIVDFRDIAKLYNINEVFDAIKDREGHMPFSDGYYAAMGTFVSRKVCAYHKQHFKVIVLDCDNTLWKGICGEEGALGIKVEKPYIKLQEFMLKMLNKGMLLTICSKNNEEDVWEVFEKNQYMILKKEHFTAWRINWEPKSENLVELAKELNLSQNSFIFIDDNPMECMEVMANCPEVLSLNLPEDSEQIPMYLDHVWAFDRLNVTKEDENRTSMYVAERKRKIAGEKMISLDEFRKGLELKMSMNLMDISQVGRVSQLTQRTNQFNLSTIRRTEKDILELIENPSIDCWVIEVSDRFGDYGLVGVVITEQKGEVINIDTLLLSCRVLGRGIEDAILSQLKKYCLENNKLLIEANFYPTEKNSPILDFMEKTMWEVVENTDGYTKYIQSVDNISNSVEFIDCYYKEIYKKQHSIMEKHTQIEDSKISNKSLDEKEYDIKNSWEVLTGNSKNILHAQYLLPLEYYSENLLLKLPIKEQNQKGFTRVEYVAPTEEMEKRLAEIWEKSLGVEKIGIFDNFFDIGGNSIKAIEIIGKLYKYNLTYNDLISNPTVYKLAKCIDFKDEGDINKFPDYMKENLKMEYFYNHEGTSDPLLELLDCQNMMLYYNIKRKFKQFNNFCELLFQDFTFYLSLDEDENIHFIDLCMLPYLKDLFTINGKSTKGYDGIIQIQKLIDSGEIVAVNTYNNRLPFFIRYQSLDAGGDETPEELAQVQHTFLIVAYDEKRMYYVEDPYSMNLQNFNPFRGNKSVGVIDKEIIIHAFNVFVNYATININEKVLLNRVDIKELIKKCIYNYHQKPYNSGGLKITYGIEAIDALINICNKGSKSLKDKCVKYPELDLMGLFDWRFYAIASRRRYLSLILKEYKGECNSSIKQILVSLCEELYQKWLEVKSYLQKRYGKGKYSFDSGFANYLVELKEMEKNMIKEMEKLWD